MPATAARAGVERGVTGTDERGGEMPPKVTIYTNVG
jgi:hypothetical protein